jgi:hypothetical protein
METLALKTCVKHSFISIMCFITRISNIIILRNTQEGRMKLIIHIITEFKCVFSLLDSMTVHASTSAVFRLFFTK